MEAQSLLPSSLQRGSVKKILLFIFLAWNILLFILVVVALSKDSSRHVCILYSFSPSFSLLLSPSTFYPAPYPLSSPIRHVSHYSFSIFLYLFSALLYLLLPLYFFLCLQRVECISLQSFSLHFLFQEFSFVYFGSCGLSKDSSRHVCILSTFSLSVLFSLLPSLSLFPLPLSTSLPPLQESSTTK